MAGRWFLLLLAATALLSGCGNAADTTSSNRPLRSELSCLGAEQSVWDNKAEIRLLLKAQFAQEVQQVLEASIPLVFEVRKEFRDGSNASESVRLKFDPLLERYELTHGTRRQSYRLSAELMEAFASTLRIEHQQAIARVRVQLDRGALPAPMRMPTLLTAAWRIDTGWCALQFADQTSPAVPLPLPAAVPAFDSVSELVSGQVSGPVSGNGGLK